MFSGKTALAAAILSEVIGTTALKYSDGFTKVIPVLVVCLGYGFAFFLLSRALITIPMAIAYAIWSALGIVLISIVGIFLFQEIPSIKEVVGLLVIILGVFILNYAK